MGFKPRDNRPAVDNSERKEFVPIVPEDGLQSVQIGLLVDLGNHKKQPKFAKDQQGNREKDDEGNDKILWPKADAVEQKVACYIDLLNQTHDYEGDIGVKNIRLPLHPVSRGMSDGLNFTTVAPRDAQKQYVKGIPWVLAPTSQFYKIAGVVKDESGKKVSEVIFDANYKNAKLNDINQLLGKPFMFNVDVKVTEKEGNKYVNTKLKSPVPLVKGMVAPDALIKAFSVNFEDDDLLEVKDDLGGIAKYDLLRVADLRKIVLAEDYAGSKMQAAVREREDEGELIKKAKEIQEKILETDRDLVEIRANFPNGPEGEAQAPKENAAKAEKPAKPQAPADDIDDAPF
jgi:hypothetical protein